MAANIWTFSAMDTLFFRDGQPMNMGESAWIDSRFPPTGVTLQGAIRATVLDHLKADIGAFQQGKPCLPDGRSLNEAIGDAKGLGNLRLTGPFLHYHGEPWFPAPLDLVAKGRGRYELLRPAEKATHCDLGHIRLPRAESVKGRYQTLAGRYLPQSALLCLLRGDAWLESEENLPLLADATDRPGLADLEPKVGLARNNRYRTHRQGMLYAIAPIRPRSGVDLRVMVEGLERDWVPQSPFPCLLGGEKRLARVSAEESAFSWPSVSLHEKANRLRFKMLFLTPAMFPKPGWLPDGFTTSEKEGYNFWRGKIGDVHLEILSAAIGKPEQIGGWNLKETDSRALQSYLPAGSVLFCEADPQQRGDIERMNGTKIGEMTEYGFGHILVGRW
jgi:CRISPR-associated protein Cmr3